MIQRSMSVILALVMVLLISEQSILAQKQKHLAAGDGLFRGTYVKFGLMTSPDADGFGDKWIAAIGFDRMIMPYLAWGLEFQPYVRSAKHPNFKYTSFTSNLFLHAKGGYPVGKLIKAKALRFIAPLKAFAVIGAGTELSVTALTFPDDDDTQFKARFAWHLVFGFEYAIGKGGLILEIQPVRVIHSELEPSSIKYSYILLGIRL